MRYVSDGDTTVGVSEDTDTNNGLSKVELLSLPELTLVILVFCELHFHFTVLGRHDLNSAFPKASSSH